MAQLTQKDREKLEAIIENEGFDYGLIDYIGPESMPNLPEELVVAWNEFIQARRQFRRTLRQYKVDFE